MITLSASGGTITFAFEDNGHYLQNGTIEVPVNSLAMVLDQSDMVTFYKAASNDIFISANLSELGKTKAEMEAWYKANMVGSSGGGTGDAYTKAESDAKFQTISGMSGYTTTADTAPLAASAFTDASYDSDNTLIKFFNESGSLVTSIDASAFIVDGMIDDVFISGGNLVIDFNTASGKEDISIPLTDIFDPSNYYTTAQTSSSTEITQALALKADTATTYTKTEVDNAITAATDGMATQTWVNNQGFLTEHQSLSAYSTTSEMNTAIDAATSGKADTSAVTAVASDLEEANRVTSMALNNLNANKADTSAVTASINAAVSGKADTSAVTAISDSLSGKADTSAVTAVANDLEEAARVTAMALNNLNSNKQDVLSAGSAVSISNNTVNVTLNTSVTSGSSNPVTSDALYTQFGGMKLLKISQSDYTNLPVKDDNTLYVITGATS